MRFRKTLKSFGAIALAGAATVGLFSSSANAAGTDTCNYNVTVNPNAAYGVTATICMHKENGWEQTRVWIKNDTNGYVKVRASAFVNGRSGSTGPTSTYWVDNDPGVDEMYITSAWVTDDAYTNQGIADIDLSHVYTSTNVTPTLYDSPSIYSPFA
ncbi:hypothetical protein [Streptomyces sp. NPDC057675]|uniref:hypothetical protein n=1 Tax=Streptomyces sp. NPDC057675 TaxID=3346204 RepID=UPI0036CF740B